MEIEYEIKEEIPPIVFTIVNKFRSNIPRSLSELLNFAKSMTGQISIECGEWIDRIEDMIDMSLNDLVFEIINLVETSMCKGQVDKPIGNAIDSCFEAFYQSLNGECKADVCSSYSTAVDTWLSSTASCTYNLGNALFKVIKENSKENP